MRALLAKGLVSPKTLAAPPRPWDAKNGTINQDASSSAKNAYAWAWCQIKLPLVKPSLFKDANDIASPKVRADVISAQFETTEKSGQGCAIS